MGKICLSRSALVQAASTVEGVEMLGLASALLCCSGRQRERLCGVQGTMSIAHFVVWRKLPFWLAAFYTVCALIKLCLDFACIRFQALTVLFPDCCTVSLCLVSFMLSANALYLWGGCPPIELITTSQFLRTSCFFKLELEYVSSLCDFLALFRAYLSPGRCELHGHFRVAEQLVESHCTCVKKFLLLDDVMSRCCAIVLSIFIRKLDTPISK